MKKEELYILITKQARAKYGGRLSAAAVQDIISDSYEKMATRKNFEEMLDCEHYINKTVPLVIKELPRKEAKRNEMFSKFRGDMVENALDISNRSYTEKNSLRALNKIRGLAARYAKGPSRLAGSRIQKMIEIASDAGIKIGNHGWLTQVSRIMGESPRASSMRFKRFEQWCREEAYS